MLDYFQGKEFDLEILHTNSKGECIDKIIKAYYEKVAALVMNARGFIYAAHFINDNIKGIKIKYYERDFNSVVAPAAKGVITGLVIQTYFFVLRCYFESRWLKKEMGIRNKLLIHMHTRNIFIAPQMNKQLVLHN